MEKATIKLKNGENPQDKIVAEMKKYTSKGYVIKAAGLDWFIYDKPSM